MYVYISVPLALGYLHLRSLFYTTPLSCMSAGTHMGTHMGTHIGTNIDITTLSHTSAGRRKGDSAKS